MQTYEKKIIKFPRKNEQSSKTINTPQKKKKRHIPKEKKKKE